MANKKTLHTKTSQKKVSQKNSTYSNTVHISGGKWRNTKLTFPSVEGLRPTHSKVREMLFNWLMFDLHDAACLDLFAGTGVLGLEALSRGAGHCDLIECNAEAVQSLHSTKTKLDATNLTVHHQDTYRFLTHPRTHTKRSSYDIIFIDPPFSTIDYESLLTQTLKLCHKGSILYLELEHGKWDIKAWLIAENLPVSVRKHKIQGNVESILLDVLH